MGREWGPAGVEGGEAGSRRLQKCSLEGRRPGDSVGRGAGHLDRHRTRTWAEDS